MPVRKNSGHFVSTNGLVEVDFLLVVVQGEGHLTAGQLFLGYLEGTLGHIADIVVTVAVAHYLALTAYIELIGHTVLAYIIGITDRAADGMRTIAADDVGSHLVVTAGEVAVVGYLNGTDHQTVLDDVVGVVIPSHEAADTVVGLNLTGIDTVDHLGVGTAHITEDTA